LLSPVSVAAKLNLRHLGPPGKDEVGELLSVITRLQIPGYLTVGVEKDEKLAMALANRAGTPDPVARLKAAHDTGAALQLAAHDWTDLLELEHVRACRRAGKSWATIGRALGVSHQQAMRRFKHRV
jgi:hypothetical protein